MRAWIHAPASWCASRTVPGSWFSRAFAIDRKRGPGPRAVSPARPPRAGVPPPPPPTAAPPPGGRARWGEGGRAPAHRPHPTAAGPAGRGGPAPAAPRISPARRTPAGRAGGEGGGPPRGGPASWPSGRRGNTEREVSRGRSSCQHGVKGRTRRSVRDHVDVERNASDVRANSRCWWRNSNGEIKRVLTIAYFDNPGPFSFSSVEPPPEWAPADAL